MLSHRLFSACGLVLATSLLAGCADSPLGGGNDARVQLRFGTAGSAALASSARFQTSGTDQLVVTGANGTLTISDIRMVVAEFELDGDDDVNPCGRAAFSNGSDDGPGDDRGGDDGARSGDDGDDCEDFDAGPLFVDLPLTGGPVAVGTGDVPAGVYDEVEFEVEDLDDDEENAVERARIDALRQQILSQFPDWPRDASMLVVGTFTPTGGTPRSFRAFIEAEIEIELGLNPALTVGEGETGSLDVTLDPQAIFRSGSNVLDLSSATGRTQLRIEMEDGFHGRGRGRGSDD
ncbi:hypothetical protein [Longimicrobium sp.]|uniref:hypothetical protein n=1 Tax=Longimicrobium sp. TaxID=2029185 RepID=UPI002E3105DF|nr:hypothetical protein [Longimicrobium sp.]HEX6042462.1 hypothetical protein [Longimicrobium sp.]